MKNANSGYRKRRSAFKGEMPRRTWMITLRVAATPSGSFQSVAQPKWR
jgi:hypothetical protein